MFLSNENKAMMWQLLSENGAFNNIENNSFNHVRQLYEKILNQISNIENINLTEKNKLTISEIMKQLSKYKNYNNTKSLEEIKTPLEEVKIQLDKDFKNKQEEFIKLVKKPTQDEIDFYDKNDTPLDNNDMESRLNNMMKMRQKELNQILPKNSNKSEKLEEPNVNLWNQWSEKSISTQEKKVSFKLDNKLNPLDKVLENQILILEQLQQIKKHLNVEHPNIQYPNIEHIND